MTFENTLKGKLAARSTYDLLKCVRGWVSDLCSGKRDWSMCIPPQIDDPDLAIGDVCDRLEAAERRIEELETQASEHTRWVLRNSVDKVELEALRDESQQNRAEISSLKAALKAADDRAEMARQGNLYVETFPKPPYIATCKTEDLP